MSDHGHVRSRPTDLGASTESAGLFAVEDSSRIISHQENVYRLVVDLRVEV